MSTLYKYPSTSHLPFSLGLQRDDTKISTLEYLEGQEVVVTEKMDGENTTLYSDYIHARSVDSRHHVSRDWVKNFWNTIRIDIPLGYRICGENLYARHSLAYDSLPTYFMGFSVWNEKNECLGWDDTLEMFELLGIEPVPTLYRGKFDLKHLQDLADSFDTNKKEGFVVRVTKSFGYNEFCTHIAKWVRSGHVQTNKHWIHQQVIANTLG